ncbi:ABC transporter ATP-binding protein [Bacillus solimangrovi]|uniref:ABC transporter ATP-binding protein n=1 Tax=Bacillus solimangrovi TaxID=1305675 RepID=A0A1E5LE78_9BACI|nr:ABC transporter ATP-binding protein [Bacillus solimangrovi]OEH92391.1 ABC transporter ATP-binding protein [Bacillus solimangrovi]
MTTILETKNLVKSYGKMDAVKNINLKLEQNTIYGLLGKNGAGKTTLLNMISGHIFSDHGEIKIFDTILNPGDSPINFCYIKEKSIYFNRSTVMEILKFASSFHKHWDWDYTNHLIKTFQINPNKKFKKLSKGMESIIGIIIGLASREPLTIFDEPLLGLDVVMREKFYNVLLEDYAENPRTILLSTHLIDEISKIVEKVYILDQGNIKLYDDIDNIRNQSNYVSGKGDILVPFLEEKNVIHRENHGQLTIAAVYDSFNETEITEANQLDISIEAMPLQKFLAYYCAGGDQNE